MKHGSFVFAWVLIAGGSAALLYTFTLPTMGTIALSPGLFPAVVSALLVVLGGIWLTTQLRARRTKGDAGGHPDDEEQSGDKRSIVAVLGMLIGYAAMFELFGFVVATPIFLVASMFFLLRTFTWKIPVVAAATTLGIILVFEMMLNVRLP